MQKKKIIILGGPTASGKSSLALEWAKEHNGEIINADSMQIYQELDVLTACPSETEMEMFPHHLYRTLKGDDPCSAERWRDLAVDVIDEVWERGKTPIVVGGTGLYLKTLVYGLSKVPEINEEIRAKVRADVNENGPAGAYAKLSEIDKEMSERLASGDSQRIARALEVILSTGKSLSHWQNEKPVGGLIEKDLEIQLNVLVRERSELYARCDLRFKNMVEEQTAINEVRALKRLEYDKTLPVMKSLGVPQIIDYLDEKLPREDMITLSQTATRQFAKRQMTWFRNQFSNWNSIKL